MNKVILIGRLVKDIELKATTSGKDVLTNSLAVKRDFKNEAGEYESDFISIVAYGNQAKVISTYCKKGNRIAIVGKWQHRSYQDKNNLTHYIDECVVNELELLESKEAKQEAKQEAKVEKPQDKNPFDTFSDEYSQDIPFNSKDDDLPF